MALFHNHLRTMMLFGAILCLVLASASGQKASVGSTDDGDILITPKQGQRVLVDGQDVLSILVAQADRIDALEQQQSQLASTLSNVQTLTQALSSDASDARDDIDDLEAAIAKMTGSDCDSDEFVYGFESDGDPRCREPSSSGGSVAGGRCGNGETVIEVKSDGSVECEDATSLLDSSRVQIRRPGNSVNCGSNFLQTIRADGTIECGDD